MASYIYDMVDTWNNGATTFTAIKMNVTDTASNAASLLMDLQVGGSSKFKVAKNGNLSASMLILDPTQTSTNYPQIGSSGSASAYIGSGNGGYVVFSTVTGSFGTNGSFHLGNSGTSLVNGDVILSRRAAANLRLGAADVGATTSTVTITIAAPGVVTWNNHGLSTGTPVVFTTTGALPTGITAGTTYYAVVTGNDTFQIASSVANAIAAVPTVITTSGTQSGTHTGTRYNITQCLGMQSVTGVTDRLGADLIIQGSQGTGTGAGGSIIFQVAPAGSSGTAQNALATALTINGNRSIKLENTGSSVTPSLYWNTSPGVFSNWGFYSPGIGLAGYATANAEVVRFGQVNGVTVYDTYAIGTTIGSPDIFITRDDANKLALRNGANAQESRIYGSYTDATNYQRMSIKTLRESSGALSGASYTTTIAIPAYANLIGVTTRVTTAITGATSYSVGDGSDVDLWGATIGVTLGSQSRTADFTAVGAVGAAATSRTVTLTANGSNFTGGVVEICLHYLTTEAD